MGRGWVKASDEGRGDAQGEDREGDGKNVGCGPAGGPVGVGAVVWVLPGVQEEAVEGADGGEEEEGRDEGGAKLWGSGEGGDEDGGGEEQTDGELFGKAVGVGGGKGACVDE
jgi:hypothetical protein